MGINVHDQTRLFLGHLSSSSLRAHAHMLANIRPYPNAPYPVYFLFPTFSGLAIRRSRALSHTLSPTRAGSFRPRKR